MSRDVVRVRRKSDWWVMRRWSCRFGCSVCGGCSTGDVDGRSRAAGVWMGAVFDNKDGGKEKWGEKGALCALSIDRNVGGAEPRSARLGTLLVPFQISRGDPGPPLKGSVEGP